MIFKLIGTPLEFHLIKAYYLLFARYFCLMLDQVRTYEVHVVFEEDAPCACLMKMAISSALGLLGFTLLCVQLLHRNEWLVNG